VRLGALSDFSILSRVSHRKTSPSGYDHPAFGRHFDRTAIGSIRSPEVPHDSQPVSDVLLQSVYFRAQRR
jgi:hypothetical protein